MKAVQVGAPGVASLVEMPGPQPVPGETTVYMAAAAMCPTDVRLVATGADPPRVPGHEVVGRLGDGTLVGVHPDIGCGECGHCRAGLENRCPARISIGLGRDGGFAEELTVPADHVIPLDGVDIAFGPLLEPLACCLHAIEMLGAREGDLALVVGAGAMGVLTMWALDNLGATVIVAQRSEARRALAARLGAHHIVAPEDDVGTVVGDRPRVAVVTAPGSEALGFALDQVSVGGAIHAFAGSPGGASIDANDFHYRHLTLVGSTGSTTSDYRRAAELVASGAVPLGNMPTTRVTLDRLPEVLVGDRRTDALKVVVTPGGERMSDRLDDRVGFRQTMGRAAGAALGRRKEP